MPEFRVKVRTCRWAYDMKYEFTSYYGILTDGMVHAVHKVLERELSGVICDPITTIDLKLPE